MSSRRWCLVTPASDGGSEPSQLPSAHPGSLSTKLRRGRTEGIILILARTSAHPRRRIELSTLPRSVLLRRLQAAQGRRGPGSGPTQEARAQHTTRASRTSRGFALRDSSCAIEVGLHEAGLTRIDWRLGTDSRERRLGNESRERRVGTGVSSLGTICEPSKARFPGGHSRPDLALRLSAAARYGRQAEDDRRREILSRPALPSD